jgi:pyruvate,orthophosphate dikinase
MTRAVHEKRRSLADYNPIMGLRGARLATAFPAVYDAQLRALFRAARQAYEEGLEIRLDLLVPYVTLVEEFVSVKARLEATAAREGVPPGVAWRAVPVIEVSGIALEADELARHADKIVIRSDKLTTSTHHLVREDSDAFLGEYVKRGWFLGDPFRIIQKSTERLVTEAIEAARRVRHDVSVMVAGDHCSNEYSLRRLLHLGVTEVCAPPRMVPIVKLIALNLEMAGIRPPAGACREA